jgi:acetolactate synthase-1/3 small subunit
MRHIISILLQNEAGALARVANLFSSRAYNIESLNVAPTDDPLISRITLVTFGSENVIEQIIKQSTKVIDVLSVVDMTNDNYLEREFVIFKIKKDQSEYRDTLNKFITNHELTLSHELDGYLNIEFIGESSSIDNLIQELKQLVEIDSMVRSGALAISKGKPLLKKY